MSLCALGLSAELEQYGIAVNALWPMTAIETSAVTNVIDPDQHAKTRKPEIMADAASIILTQDATYTYVELSH